MCKMNNSSSCIVHTEQYDSMLHKGSIRSDFIVNCCMKPYNIKGAAMPTYTILAQVKLNIGTGQSSCSTTVTDGEIYLARPILAVPYCSWIDSVTQSWRRSNSVFGPSKL